MKLIDKFLSESQDSSLFKPISILKQNENKAYSHSYLLSMVYMLLAGDGQQKQHGMWVQLVVFVPE